MLKQRNRTFGDGKHLQTGTLPLFDRFPWSRGQKQKGKKKKQRSFRKEERNLSCWAKLKGKKKKGRKLPQIKGRHRCLKDKWKGKEERQKKKKNRRRSSRKKKNQGLAGMENESEKVGVGQNNKVAMD